MDSLNAYADRMQSDVPLADLTWFKLGGVARHLFSPANVDELCDVLRWAKETHMPVRVLGGGANLLVRDAGFDGLVIRLDQTAFLKVTYTDVEADAKVGVDGDAAGADTVVIAGGGVDLMSFTQSCAHRGYQGLECLAGIPGTVGGAVRMSAGGRFGSIGTFVERAELVDLSGSRFVVMADALAFGYRSSAVGDRIVTAVTFRLTRGLVDVCKQRYQEIWRQKMASQPPMSAHSAGCMFKNPPGESAGRLIDEAGLKGTRFGKARVSEMHGNFIVADEGATAAEVLRLTERVRDEVRAQTGYNLELEVEVW